MIAAITVALLLASGGARPNIVVVLADDQGWGDLGINGNPAARTPRLDNLARQGTRFDRFFVQPVCAPTRAEFLTGRWHPRGGVHGVSTGAERLDLDERTIADMLSGAGYATGCFGKWHNGSQYPYHPLGRGFGEYYGYTSGHWGDYFSPPLDHNGRLVRGRGFLTDDITNQAMSFIGDNALAKKPFFCFLALNTPHSPMQVPDPYWNRFKDADLPPAGVPNADLMHARAALAMGENIDDNMGRMLDKLAELKIERDTIVAYFSDNGPNGPRFNGGMRGIKGTTDEGGTRSPLVIRWPGRIPPGGVVKPIAGAVDLLPTLASLAGVVPEASKPLDGINLAPWVLGGDAPAPDRILFAHWGGRTSARGQTRRLDAQGRLYDMENDPGQKTDIAEREPAIRKRLADAVAAWRSTVLAETPLVDNRPFPVGHKELPRAFLPARDGVPHGGIRRSAPAPNCSYFTRWTKPSDRMTWSVGVANAGRFEAIVHYACPKEDIGSEIRLSLGGAQWKGVVSEAHDPPARGAENDRVPRKGESLVKDFKPMSLGEAFLPAGMGTLELSSPRVGGGQVAEIRALELVMKP